jgi:hypothetical protein
LLVVIGLTYSITSLNKLFSYLYGDISVSNGNVILMSTGIIIPLYIFIYGIFYFVYYDSDITRINKRMLILSFLIIIFGIIIMIFKLNYFILNVFGISQIVYFLHPSFGYLSVILGVLSSFVCIKYKL